MTPASTDRVLVDTNVFSYLFRRDPRAGFYGSHLQGKHLGVSFVTVAELYYGAFRAHWGSTRVQSLERSLRNYVVAPYNYELCIEWARIKRQLERRGVTMAAQDLWIAACARHYHCALATNDLSGFSAVDGLTVIAPTA